MEKDLVKLYEKEMCNICTFLNCKHNIKYVEQNNLKRVYCSDYKTTKKHINKKKQREFNLIESDKVKHIFLMVGRT